MKKEVPLLKGEGHARSKLITNVKIEMIVKPTFSQATEVYSGVARLQLDVAYSVVSCRV